LFIIVDANDDIIVARYQVCQEIDDNFVYSRWDNVRFIYSFYKVLCLYKHEEPKNLIRLKTVSKSFIVSKTYHEKNHDLLSVNQLNSHRK